MKDQNSSFVKQGSTKKNNNNVHRVSVGLFDL